MKTMLQKIKAGITLSKIRKLRSIRDKVERQIDPEIMVNLIKTYPNVKVIITPVNKNGVYIQMKDSEFQVSTETHSEDWTFQIGILNYIKNLRIASNTIYSINILKLK